MLGLRKGEALALRWDDVDFDRKLLRVKGTLSRINKQLVVTTPKTFGSRRTIPLGDDPIALLKTQRKEQMKDRLRAANILGRNRLRVHHRVRYSDGPAQHSAGVPERRRKYSLCGANIHSLRHARATSWLRPVSRGRRSR